VKTDEDSEKQETRGGRRYNGLRPGSKQNKTLKCGYGIISNRRALSH